MNLFSKIALRMILQSKITLLTNGFKPFAYDYYKCNDIDKKNIYASTNDDNFNDIDRSFDKEIVNNNGKIFRFRDLYKGIVNFVNGSIAKDKAKTLTNCFFYQVNQK